MLFDFKNTLGNCEQAYLNILGPKDTRIKDTKNIRIKNPRIDVSVKD